MTAGKKQERKSPPRKKTKTSTEAGLPGQGLEEAPLSEGQEPLETLEGSKTLEDLESSPANSSFKEEVILGTRKTDTEASQGEEETLGLESEDAMLPPEVPGEDAPVVEVSSLQVLGPGALVMVREESETPFAGRPLRIVSFLEDPEVTVYLELLTPQGLGLGQGVHLPLFELTSPTLEDLLRMRPS